MTNPKSTASIAGHPIHPMLVPFPIAFLVGTLVGDIVFNATDDEFWALAAFWLLAGALVMAALAAVAGLVDFLGEGRIRAITQAWLHMLGNAIVVLISLYNFYLRYELGLAAYPDIAWISLVAVLILLFNGWMGWEMVYRHRVGIADEPPRTTL